MKRAWIRELLLVNGGFSYSLVGRAGAGVPWGGINESKDGDANESKGGDARRGRLVAVVGLEVVCFRPWWWWVALRLADWSFLPVNDSLIGSEMEIAARVQLRKT